MYLKWSTKFILHDEVSVWKAKITNTFYQLMVYLRLNNGIIVVFFFSVKVRVRDINRIFSVLYIHSCHKVT